MKKQTEKLTDDERAFALASIEHTKQTREFERAARWIDRACIYPLKKWKTCSVNHVRHAMFQSVGIKVSEEAMGLALAHVHFSSCRVGGEWSTNVGLKGLRSAARGAIAEGFEIKIPPGWADDLGGDYVERGGPRDALLLAVVRQW